VASTRCLSAIVMKIAYKTRLSLATQKGGTFISATQCQLKGFEMQLELN